MPAAAMRLELVARRDELVAQRVLHAQIDGELDRLLQPVGGKAGQVQVGKAVAVEPFLDAGNALVVDIDVADEVRDLGAVRIDALVLVEEADARQADADRSPLLLRRDVALEPDEAALGAEPLAQLRGVEIRQHGGEQLDRLVDIDDAGAARRRARARARRSPGFRRCGRGCRAARSPPRRRSARDAPCGCRGRPRT